MTDIEQLCDIIQLISTDGIGAVTFFNLLHKTGNIKSALEAASQKKVLYEREKAVLEVENAKRLGIKIIAYCDNEYPQSLLQLNDAPPILYALGNIELLHHNPAIAIVGGRNASIAGRKIASRISYDLTNNDVLVISGMARGIDSAAHKGALYAKNQQGSTIAVLGTGVDEIYPNENTDLYHDILKQGLLISEFPLGTKAQIPNFPRRNRIISALAAGTVVVEAGLHSGSLITAKLALEQGKDIFAVPGSPMEPRSAGSNQLIKDGALLTECADDILNTLSIQSAYQIKKQQINTLPLDKPQNNVNISPQKNVNTLNKDIDLLNLISFEGVDIDELLRLSNLSQADFFMQILDLEFAGKIQRQTGNKVARIK